MSLGFSSAYAKDFIRENDITGLWGQVADAHKTVNQKSGLGNDFLGWVDLPLIMISKSLTALKRRLKKFNLIQTFL